MPRIRTLKPELATDVKLARVSRDARYTFVLLITQADDEGLIGGAHRQLLGALYPHDEDVTAASLIAWVEELVECGVVRWRATRDGAPVLELTNWSKHQRVDNKGRSQLAIDLVPLEDTPPDIGGSRNLAEVRGDSPRVAESRGLDLGPRTNDLGPVLAGRTRRGRHTDDGFEEFWRGYPRRAGGNPRRKALNAWQARLREGVRPSTMLEGGHRYAAFCAATGKVGTEYVMQGATFLGPDRRFEDEWALPAKESRGPTPLDEMTQRYGDWFTESLRPAKPEHVA